MEHRFKTRISRMFRGSFGSCRTGNLSEMVEKPVFIPQNSHYNEYFHLMEPLTRPFPSICKPNCPEITTRAISNSIFPRQKISGAGRYPPFVSAGGHSCPPVSPVSPFLNPFYKKPKKNKKKKKTSSSQFKNGKNNRRDWSLFSSSSQDSAYFEDKYYWFSSEEEEDEESDTLFSSRSLSSDSSSHHHHHSRRHRRNKESSSRRRRASTAVNKGILPLHGKVKDSFAVVKSSSDPYNDFRTSMVEMIVEKQIFTAKDLEQLLQCFLSLNSDNHHNIILEVFTEIWEALFSNWS
ncbi:transcription repressor OFP8 [Mercurialis annua]|uniref:transcription repressor OFP8 n=1 Tax=Mercurialis annua TaxID=3986 RepID=UPI002160D3DB|nr:transcription repressor OFP8 [Mercurialis annua]